MRTTHTANDWPMHKVRIPSRQYHLPRVLIHCIRLVQVPEEWRCQQTGDIRVIHDIPPAVPINLVRVYVPVHGITHNPVLLNRFAQLGRKGVHLTRQLRFRAEILHDLCTGSEVPREHHIRGNEELVDGRIVGWAEGTADQTCALLNGIATAGVAEGLGTGGGEAGERVRRCVDGPVGRVGSDHEFGNSVHDGLNCRDPLEIGEEGEVISSGVVVCRDFEEGSKAVELVFAFEDGLVAVWRVDCVIGARCIVCRLNA